MKEYKVEHYTYLSDVGFQSLNIMGLKGWELHSYEKLSDTNYKVLFIRNVPMMTVLKIKLNQAAQPIKNYFKNKQDNTISWLNDLEPIKKRRKQKTLSNFRKM
jgi:hypothetical protein